MPGGGGNCNVLSISSKQNHPGIDLPLSHIPVREGKRQVHYLFQVLFYAVGVSVPKPAENRHRYASLVASAREATASSTGKLYTPFSERTVPMLLSMT